MAIETPDFAHAAASITYNGVGPSLRFIRQSGFLSVTRTGPGVYRLVLAQALSVNQCVAGIVGRDGYGAIPTLVHVSDTIKDVYLFGVDGNARDASIDVVLYAVPLGSPATAGADLVPPSAGTGGGGGGPPTGPAGGDLGGTYPDPLVIAMETTNGGQTRLAFGDIADGQIFLRDGSDVVGLDLNTDNVPNLSDVPGASTTDALNDLQDQIADAAPSMIVVGPYSTTDFYDTNDNPLTGQEDYSLVILFYAGPWATGDQFLFGTYDSDTAGGVGLWYNATQVISRCRDGGGNVNQMTLTPPTMRQFGHVVHLVMTFDGDDGAGQTDTFLYANGTRTNTTHTGGSGPMSDPGDDLRVGMRFSAAPDAGATSLYIMGMAYLLGVMTPTQVDNHYQQCMTENRFADLPGSTFTRGWRAGDGGGANWAPFVGAGNMVRTGTTPQGIKQTRAWF